MYLANLKKNNDFNFSASAGMGQGSSIPFPRCVSSFFINYKTIFHSLDVKYCRCTTYFNALKN